MHGGPTPELDELIDAAELDQDRARQLLAADPELLERRNSLGETAIHHLVIENFVRGVRFLVDAGANLDTRDNFGSTPLAHAVTLGNAPMVRILLDAGADPNTTDSITETPLHIAARRGDAEIFAALVRAGADPACRTDTDEAPLDEAPPALRKRLEEIINQDDGGD
jgi:ankyrin repeat protein